MATIADTMSAVFERIKDSAVMVAAIRESEASRDARRAVLVAERDQLDSASAEAVAKAKQPVVALEPLHAKAKVEFARLDSELRTARHVLATCTTNSDTRRSKIDAELAELRLPCIAEFLAKIDADVSRVKRKGAVDKLAAAYILQGYLDRHLRKPEP